MDILNSSNSSRPPYPLKDLGNLILRSSSSRRNSNRLNSNRRNSRSNRSSHCSHSSNHLPAVLEPLLCTPQLHSRLWPPQ